VKAAAFCSAALNRVRRFGLKLFLNDLDIGGSWLLPNSNAVNASPIWAEWPPKFDDLSTPISGVADADDRANLEGFCQILRGHN